MPSSQGLRRRRPPPAAPSGPPTDDGYESSASSSAEVSATTHPARSASDRASPVLATPHPIVSTPSFWSRTRDILFQSVDSSIQPVEVTGTSSDQDALVQQILVAAAGNVVAVIVLVVLYLNALLVRPYLNSLLGALLCSLALHPYKQAVVAWLATNFLADGTSAKLARVYNRKRKNAARSEAVVTNRLLCWVIELTSAWRSVLLLSATAAVFLGWLVFCNLSSVDDTPLETAILAIEGTIGTVGLAALALGWKTTRAVIVGSSAYAPAPSVNTEIFSPPTRVRLNPVPARSHPKSAKSRRERRQLGSRADGGGPGDDESILADLAGAQEAATSLTFFRPLIILCAVHFFVTHVQQRLAEFVLFVFLSSLVVLRLAPLLLLWLASILSTGWRPVHSALRIVKEMVRQRIHGIVAMVMTATIVLVTLALTLAVAVAWQAELGRGIEVVRDNMPIEQVDAVLASRFNISLQEQGGGAVAVSVLSSAVGVDVAPVLEMLSEKGILGGQGSSDPGPAAEGPAPEPVSFHLADIWDDVAALGTETYRYFIEGGDGGDGTIENALSKSAVSLEDSLIRLWKSSASVLQVVGLYVVSASVLVSSFLFSLLTFVATLTALLSMETDFLDLIVAMIPAGGAGDEARARFTVGLRHAIKSVLLSPVKIASFHALLTWLLLSIVDAPMVLSMMMIAGLLAVFGYGPVPCVGMAVWLLSTGHLWSAVLVASVSTAAWMVVDTAIYSEIYVVAPYITGLSIVLGMYAFGLQGVITGPLLVCLLVCIYDVVRRS